MMIFDQTLGTLEHSLDVRLERHNALAGNLANANTPGFVPRDVDFQAALASEISGPIASVPESNTISLGDATGIPARPGAAVSLATPMTSAPQSGVGIDGNRVDVDKTMTALAENALQYGATARAASKKLAILRYVASDGNA